MLAELAFRPAVDLQHAERRAVALQDDVHRAANAVLDQQVPASGTAARFRDGWRSPACRCARQSPPAMPDRRRRWPCRRRPHPSRRRRAPAAGFRTGGIPAPCSIPRRALRPSDAPCGSSRSMKVVPCSASTPSSARISCCRMRRRSERSWTSRVWLSPGFGSTTGSPSEFGGVIWQEIAQPRSLRLTIGKSDHPPLRRAITAL